jgi:hypothetical protein
MYCTAQTHPSWMGAGQLKCDRDLQLNALHILGFDGRRVPSTRSQAIQMIQYDKPPGRGCLAGVAWLQNRL